MPAFLWAFVILLLSVFPGNKFPEAPFLGFDKLVHSGIYFVLMCLFLWGIRMTKKGKEKLTVLILVSFLVIIYGGIMELIQKYIVINRSGNWYDFFANMLGVILAMMFYPLMIKLLPLKR